MQANRTGNGRRRLVVLVLLGVLAAAIAFAYYNRNVRVAEKLGGDRQREAWPVDVLTIEPELFVERITATGILQAQEEAVLTAEVSAKVRAIRADLGDKVHQGQALVVLDQATYALTRQSAAAELSAAKSAAKLADEDYERAKKLFAKGHISQAEMDQIRTQHEAATARRQLAEASFGLAARNLNETVIRAPFSGRVSARTASIGELAAPGTPILTLVKDTVLKIDLALSEMEVMRVQAGMPVELTLPALDDEEFTGRVTRVGVAADKASGSFPVRVELDNADGRLMAGMRCAAAVELARIPESIAIVRDQVVQLNGRQGAYVAVEAEGGYIAQARPLKLGSRDGERVLVEEGLSAGELLVVIGQRSINDGSKLQIVHRDGVRVEPPTAEAMPAAEATPADRQPTEG